MFKQLVVTSFVLANISCTSILSKTIKDAPTVNQQAPEITNANCPGNVDLPPELAGKLTPVNDTALLNSSIGKPNKGIRIISFPDHLPKDQQMSGNK